MDISTCFNQFSEHYDDSVEKNVMRYREMFWAMLYYLPQDYSPLNILELGCGTGNLTALLHQHWPDSQIRAVDLSAKMLDIMVKKLNTAQVIPVESDFESLEIAPESVDLVISSLAFHHIGNVAKARLVEKIFTGLRPQGFFVLGDQFRSANERIFQANMTFYKAYIQEQGLDPHQGHAKEHKNHHHGNFASLDDLTQWMQEAGFQSVDRLWHYCIWAVIQGQK